MFFRRQRYACRRKGEIATMKVLTILLFSLLLGSSGVSTYAATLVPSAPEAGKPKPRKSKRLAPPCADEPADKTRAGKKKAG